ncbi:acyl-CoA-binding domain-containing protein 4 isoform X1 [Seriola aureovittata]|uniref:acyl-CoA-binding domain-containing protein 4 isoform X1 n=1 Tax=Seriola aureovittata TaxID=2871759 RepID=UPI0024BE7E5A|nr:acyl-CoA-binding domain-containing protein 4 isoform X1 [Seriola aureovittata]XP_056222716.1 acyl-CoA-binding domain-containing protein 4 isoform X1 [Seriola aureovittata]XP_056222717.1 acyl-CoA-binding domain-containing protein 4 isoform X1 [Seriola aureovittata]XP_056222718.1 acyl-CoA-binding domain-containing protein 4 isoform X1 [Seriola aureovittata]
MPVPAMAEPVVDHQKRFQAAVDLIHNLPKNGSYRPSYEVMLRFYSLYKQAVCGPCTVPRPGFWDPVGRYKWDAWSRLGEMSSESAMAVYVEEMKKVAQEVIATMPMNEKTASLFHHFEPLYLVIDDMPRPPGSLLTLSEGLKGSGHAGRPSENVRKCEDKEQEVPKEDSSLPEDADQEFSLAEVIDLTANTISNAAADSGVSECLVLTSDSESEIFCDSVDSVEQLGNIKIPVVKSNSFQNGHVSSESSPCLEARQVGAGQGGEGADDKKGQGPISRRRDSGREGYYHNWIERGVPQGSPRWGAPGGGGGGAGRGGGDGSEGGAERLHDTQLQQQIIVALQRLREDMRSVMDRLEVVERLAATHAQGSEWRPCLQCAATASHQQEERCWPFDISGQTVLLFLVWPFVAQGLVYLLRKAQRRSGISS